MMRGQLGLLGVALLLAACTPVQGVSWRLFAGREECLTVSHLRGQALCVRCAAGLWPPTDPSPY